ncbi:hypothetical protein ACTXT7_010717 [Hymenolepis weldensis]
MLHLGTYRQSVEIEVGTELESSCEGRSKSMAIKELKKRSRSNAGSISERSGLGRFGQRLSSIRRKAERLKHGNSAPGSGLRPALAQANFSFILPSPFVGGKEENVIKSFDYDPPVSLNPTVFLRKTKSEYKIDESRRKFITTANEERQLLVLGMCD